MNRTHLTTLDRALLRLLDERARLCAEADGAAPCAPSVDDLLRRADGDFDPGVLEELFDLVHRGSGPRGGAR